MLIRKGYKHLTMIPINIENSWNAGFLYFEEYEDGHSYLGLYKFHQYKDCPAGAGCSTRLATYRKLKAAEKWEIIGIIAQLPKYENKN